VGPVTVVFLHVPKTAGSSLASMLAANFAPERVYTPKLHGELKVRAAHDLADFDFISGHFDWSELAAIPGPMQIVSLMREPVQRALSLYWYLRAHTWAYGVEEIGARGVEFAKSLNMGEFFATAPPDVLGGFDNAVARQLAGAECWKLDRGFTIPDREVARICRRHIDQMRFCGVTEHFDATAAAILRSLELPATASRRENTLAELMGVPGFETVPLTPPSADLMARLRRLTAIDSHLYHYVRRRWPMRHAVLSHAMRRLGRPRDVTVPA
jgi:Sulfotransferase family